MHVLKVLVAACTPSGMGILGSTTLGTALVGKEARQEQAAELVRLRGRARRAGRRAAAAERKLHKVRAEARELAEGTRAQRTLVDQAELQLAAARDAALAAALASARQAQAAQLAALREELAALRRQRMRTLLEVLPLSLPALLRPASGGGGGGGSGGGRAGGSRSPTVLLCGLRLPDTLAPSLADLHSFQELDTALGRLAQLVALAASYLDAPLGATLGARGSSSQIWRPRSFWCAEPPAAAPPLALHVRAAPPPQPAPLPAGAQGSSAMYTLSSLTQHWESLKQTASAAPVRPSRRAAEELGAALRLLARGVAAMVAGHLGPAAARLPPDWSPFACLAAMCLHVASAESRSAAARRLGGPGWGDLGPGPPCASVAALAASAMPLAGSLLLRAAELGGVDSEGLAFDGAEEEDDDADGWDVTSGVHAAAAAELDVPGMKGRFYGLRGHG
ncbi:hypothetical protein WJX81_004057 [Elliptochloris bilobata]|uniref:Uncharacterized protein n=1 Tax=Elliptochloris bilobata TaxID=381761 RepID=A0AAW1RJL6_9CHLO